MALPRFKVGDSINYLGRPYTVKSVYSYHMYIEDVKTHNVINVSIGDLVTGGACLQKDGFDVAQTVAADHQKAIS